MCRRVSGSVGPGAMLQPHVCYIDMVGWQLTAVWPGSSCCQLSAAAWQRLSSAPCPPTSCAPAAETDGDPRHHNPGREQRVTYVVIKLSSLQPPASSLQPRHVLRLLGGGLVQGELHLHTCHQPCIFYGITWHQCRWDVWIFDCIRK